MEPIDSRDPFLFHKTTQRGVFEKARKDSPACEDVLLFNEQDELTEFTIGNLVVEREGKLFTPPVSCGLLPGTFRAFLLESGQVAEARLPVGRLNECTKIFRVNSVREWEEVTIAPPELPAL
jgi:para-aminobenzoate synthetase/4-amino-4-deoxychorismate lyase